MQPWPSALPQEQKLDNPIPSSSLLNESSLLAREGSKWCTQLRTPCIDPQLQLWRDRRARPSQRGRIDCLLWSWSIKNSLLFRLPALLVLLHCLLWGRMPNLLTESAALCHGTSRCLRIASWQGERPSDGSRWWLGPGARALKMGSLLPCRVGFFPTVCSVDLMPRPPRTPWAGARSLPTLIASSGNPLKMWWGRVS